MTDGLIGNDHVTVPDLMDPVIAFRTLNYNPPTTWTEPNEFKVDIATGQIVRNEELIVEKREEYGGEEYGRFTSPQYNKKNEAWTKHMTAKCGALKDHKAPHKDCSCGLYCYYELKETTPHYSYNAKETAVCVSVYGSIEAHNTGMRCEKMTIEAIYSLSYKGLTDLCKELGIALFPIESYNRGQFLNACTEYGDPLPKNMRAEKTVDDELPW